MVNNFLENISILIADDKTDDLEILNKVLSKYFKKIYVASDGEEAFKLYKNNKDIDIIISDINMENIDGLKLLKLIRLSDLNLPFILISGNFQKESLIEAINLNVSSFLTKPINVKDLIEKVDILCEKKLFEQRVKSKQDEINNYLASVDSVAIIFKMNGEGKITYMNDAMKNISGYLDENLNNLMLNDILHPTISKEYIEEAWKKVKSGELWKGTTKYIDKNNEVFYLNHTVFKLETKKDEFISIAFLATKESIEKRDFHKKVISTFKEYNIREYEYKNKLELLQKELETCKSQMTIDNSEIVNNLKLKIRKQESQIKEYEKQLEANDQKYNTMLLSKKDEIERYINQIQIDKIQADKHKDENKYLKKAYEQLKKQFELIKEDNIDMYKKILDLKEIIRIEEEKNNN